MPTRVQSSNLNEELGQISHIFSDKTGTLTSNIMQFRRFSAGHYSYGYATLGDDDAAERKPTKRTKDPSKIPNVEFSDPSFDKAFAEPNKGNYANIERMLTNLAVNHTVQVESKFTDKGNILYNASSPDELALVNGARYLGITYTGRDTSDNNIYNVSFRGEETR